jgi:ribosome-associated protein
VSDGIAVTGTVFIPRAELTTRATRSGGPGGQHVNTSSTRIELVWNVDRTTALDDETRARVRARLGARIDSDGNLRVVASESRSQRRNRDDAEARLAALVRRALAVPKVRRATRPSASAVAQRLDEKRRRSRLKSDRRTRPRDEGE